MNLPQINPQWCCLWQLAPFFCGLFKSSVGRGWGILILLPFPLALFYCVSFGYRISYCIALLTPQPKIIPEKGRVVQWILAAASTISKRLAYWVEKIDFQIANVSKWIRGVWPEQAKGLGGGVLRCSALELAVGPQIRNLWTACHSRKKIYSTKKIKKWIEILLASSQLLIGSLRPKGRSVEFFDCEWYDLYERTEFSVYFPIS